MQFWNNQLRRIFLPGIFLAMGCAWAQSPAPAADPAKPAAAAASPAAATSKSETKAPDPDPKNPRAWMWLYQLPDFSDQSYRTAVEALLADYEKKLGRKLEPGSLRRAGIKVNTNTPSQATPPALVRAVITALEARGFKATELFIVDQSENQLHDAGFLPLNAHEGEGVFDGVQVIALERGRYYSLKWSYDSNVSPPDGQEQATDRKKYDWGIEPTYRQSLLPVPLLLAVDFWINLPVGMDDGSVGVSGALVDATLYAASNTARFFENAEAGAKAVADMAAIPELQRGWVCSLLSLEHYQFIGGPVFNSLYTRSEPFLLMSPNPVMLDQMLFERINQARTQRRLDPLDRPAYLNYAGTPALHLGTDDPKKMFLVRLP
jgi:hypothetical protein